MTRSLVVTCLLFAGVWLLAGLGWALVTASVLVFAFWPQGADNMLAVFTRRAATLGRRAVVRVKAAPRRAVAGGGMAAGLVLAPVGFAVALGVGAGLMAAGVGLVGLSLLTGNGA